MSICVELLFVGAHEMNIGFGSKNRVRQAPTLEQEVIKDWNLWEKLLNLSVKKDSFFYLLAILESGSFICLLGLTICVFW
jgi:hypothetical protein